LTEARLQIDPYYLPPPDCQISGLGKLLEEVFGRRDDGVFVEVGAFDGRSFSNTDFLASLGWRGLYIEPVPEFFHNCLEWHRGNRAVQVVNCAIGAEEGEIQIHVGGPLSTSLDGQRQHYERLAWAKGQFVESRCIRTTQRRLDNLLKQHDFPKPFDLLVVDVEGMELEVFKSFDLSEWAPRMAIVELEDFHSSFAHLPEVVERCQAVRRLFASQGYRERYVDSINTVFIRD
jgi:FkbM family methyltransferase